MINSIQHFQQNGVKRLLKIFEEYRKDLTKMAEMVYGVTKEVTNLGLYWSSFFVTLCSINTYM